MAQLVLHKKLKGSVEKEECGLWKMRGVVNAECGKCRKFQFQYQINKYIYILIERVFYNIVTLAC